MCTIRAPRPWEESPVPADALVSVIVPCYNQAHYLAEAVESVRAQSHLHHEIVVVDDGSSDATPEVAAALVGVRLIRQPNQGLAGARNSGARNSRGSFLVFLDADDRLRPEALETGIEIFASHPGCAMVAGHHVNIDSDGAPQARWPGRRVVEGHYYGLLQSNFVAAIHAVMFRREAFEALGGFAGSYPGAEDYQLYLRLARRYPVYCHDVAVAEYRRHGDNMTVRDPALLLASSIRALRSQRRHVRREPAYLEAYRAGLRHWRDDYGRSLVEKTRKDLGKGRFSAAGRGLLALLRYYPAGLRYLPFGPTGRRRAGPAAIPVHDGGAVAGWLRAEVEYRDRIVAQRDEAIAWLRKKLAESEAALGQRDEAIAWLRGELEASGRASEKP